MFRENLPSSVLRSIVERAAVDLDRQRSREPLADLQAKVASAEPPRRFYDGLAQGFGLIAEIKVKSPSRGPMRHRDVDRIARTYSESSAVRAVSVLTNEADFGMSVNDLQRVRRLVPQPILRKDFIFDPYQIWQARAYGADALLLMANVVTQEGLAELAGLATSLGMEVLFESHEASEVKKLPPSARVCGINSRRFMAGKGKSTRAAYWISSTLRKLGVEVRDLTINPAQFELVDSLPPRCLKVAESGIEPSMIATIRDELGFHAILVGTSILMAKRGVQFALQAFEREIDSKQLSLPLRSGHALVAGG